MRATTAAIPSLLLSALLLALAGCDDSKGEDSSDGGGSEAPSATFAATGVGTSQVHVSLPGDNGEYIAVRLDLPSTGRYSATSGTEAPLVVEVGGYLTTRTGFTSSLNMTPQGVAQVTFLWPGLSDPATGYASSGDYDYGGTGCLSALRHVMRFALGLTTTWDGYSITDLTDGTGIALLLDNVGMYAFSHPGIAATNVMALYGDELTGVSYFVGRENPTQDVLTAVELGHWDTQPPNAVDNVFYDYAADYSPVAIDLGADYAHVGWDPTGEGKPFFDDGMGHTYTLGERVPGMYGKRYYSRKLTRALLDNGALTLANWPADLATPDEADGNWGLRETVGYYPDVGAKHPGLKVMLVFADDDHVQPMLDKPHIHQAFDGFVSGASLSWVRMNPDRAYVESIYGSATPMAPDLDANWQPADWSDMRPYAYPKASLPQADQRVPLAALAEMADRTRSNDWSANLSVVLP